VSFLPNAHSVHIEPSKLTYLLTTGKAQFFILHGFDPNQPHELDAALRQHPTRNRVESASHTVHGDKYTVRCTLPSPDGRDPCALTVWMVDVGQIEARVVTGYASP
jgi:filamentous hemagglutinin